MFGFLFGGVGKVSKGHSRKTRIETQLQDISAAEAALVPKAIPEKQGLKPFWPPISQARILESQRPFQKNKD